MLIIQNPHLSEFLILFTKTSNSILILITPVIVCLSLFLRKYRIESLLLLLCIFTLTASNVLFENYFNRKHSPFERLIE